jgi:3-hydroxy-D-aspartate aldolase
MNKFKGIPTNMGLDHIGIVVPNAAEAARFLMDVFDAQFDWEVKREVYPTAEERGWSTLFGIHPQASLPHVIMLKCGDQSLTQYIELFEWHSPDQSSLSGENGWHKFSDLGNAYISFMVKDLQLVVDHIKEKVIPKWQGVRFIQDPPMQFPLKGEICTSTFLVSPWGMWIELTNWSKSSINGRVISAQQSLKQNQYIGSSINDLPTPTFFIDLDIIDHNIHLLKTHFEEKAIDWIVPAKAHKCPEFSHYILEKSQAKGIVLLTLADAGIQNIYLANQFFEDQDFTRLSLLAKRLKCLCIPLDNISALKKLQKAIERWEMITPIEVLIELNINHNRCGVDAIEEAVALAQSIHHIETSTGSLIFSGITGYEGHTPVLPPEEKKLATQQAHEILKKAKRAIESIGIKVNKVSGGGSCNYIECLDTEILTEIQAGGAILGDLVYLDKANLKQHGYKSGAFLLTQIITLPFDKRRAVGNAGFKQCGWHPFGGYPQPRDYKDMIVVGLSAEHIRFQHREVNKPLGVMQGEKIVLIPGYNDSMAFLHNEIYATRNNKVEQVWKII